MASKILAMEPPKPPSTWDCSSHDHGELSHGSQPFTLLLKAGVEKLVHIFPLKIRRRQKSVFLEPFLKKQFLRMPSKGLLVVSPSAAAEAVVSVQLGTLVKNCIFSSHKSIPEGLK